MKKSKGSIVDDIKAAYKDYMLCRLRILANARLVERDPKLISERWLLNRIACKLWNCDRYDRPTVGGCENMINRPAPPPSTNPFSYYRPNDKTWVRRFWDDNTEGEPGRINEEALLNILLKYTYIMLSYEDKRWIWWRVQKERPDMMNVVKFYDDMAADYDPLKDVDDEEPEPDKADDTILDLMERASETVKEARHERRCTDTAAQGRDDCQGP